MRKSVCIAAMLAMIAVSSYGAGEEKGYSFDPKIDAWVDGTIIALDADGQKITVRGVKMPYATAHCSMMQEIQNNKGDEANIRRNWSDKLAKADAENPGTESDFNMAFPAKGSLKIMDESAVAGADFLYHDRVMKSAASADKGGAAREVQVTAGNEGRTAEQKDAQAMMTMKDLKIGDRVICGYDSGVITNEAYAIVKRNLKPADQKAPAAR